MSNDVPSLVNTVNESRLRDSSDLLLRIGHVKISKALSHGFIDNVYSEVAQTAQRQSFKSGHFNGRLEENVSSYGEGWTFSENLWRYSPRLLRFLTRGALAKIARHLFENVFGSAKYLSLLRDQTYFKNPGSESTPWHQDGTFLPLPGLKSLTFWIPFMDIDATLSPMHYVDCSQERCWLGSFSSDDEQKVDNFYAFYDYFLQSSEEITAYDNVAKGDILVHDSWTLHGSPPHTGSKSRLAMVVVYYIANGDVDICPSIRMINDVNTSQARALRFLNESLLFPGMNGLKLSSSNSRTPLVRF